MPEVKRLILDIEVTPDEVYVWETGWKVTIPYVNIIEERKIIMIGWKWEGERQTHCEVWDGEDDYELLKRFAPVLEQADVVIGHNSTRFDLPWIRTRAAHHRIPIIPILKEYDTFQVAKRVFKFNSNALGYIAPFLGIGQKIKTDYQLWRDVKAGDEKALARMVRYCKNDVKMTEQVYHIIENYGPLKTHEGVVMGRGKESCPRCGSLHTQYRGTATRKNEQKFVVSAVGYKRQRLQCQECGKWFLAPVAKGIQTRPPKKCLTHPRYRAIRAPKIQCKVCWRIWKENRG